MDGQMWTYRDGLLEASGQVAVLLHCGAGLTERGLGLELSGAAIFLLLASASPGRGEGDHTGISDPGSLPNLLGWTRNWSG